ncbi:MAG: M14 family metallopeptidase [Caulobacteraceae bacterium]|nr:M14 family metallopeptidase [Caulobacteraceae bacterium]
MNPADHFSADYPEARGKFCAAARQAGAALERLSNPNLGPDGGDISTDIAWFGPTDAPSVLVLLSGTHGVEGFCGSGAQVDWMARGEAGRLPDGVAALLVHAINPYGFAWLRRVTEENVDLNRNWVDFEGPLPDNAGYLDIHDALCPRDWDEAARSRGGALLAGYAAKEGYPAFVAAATGGQYARDDGIFFGGAGETWARRTQTQILGHYLRAARDVAIIDFHTGIGPWGHGERMSPASRSTLEFKRAAEWYGAAVTSLPDGSSSSAVIRGDGLSGAIALLPHARTTPMALEFGTRPGGEVLDALRADNWLHRWGDPLGPQAKSIKATIRDAFYGDTDDWKGMVAGQSLLACRQAVAGLAAALACGSAVK